MRDYYQELADILAENELVKVEDQELQFIGCYFIDKNNEEKYLLGCKTFEDIAELAEKWEEYQDIDLAMYLQGQKFAHSYIRWDMYFLLVYTGAEELPLTLVHKIEHDKFCARKIVLAARDEQELKEQLNFKLPFTREFYKFKALEKVGDDREFFNLLRAEAGLAETNFSDELFRDLSLRKNDFLLKLEGGVSDEPVQDSASGS